MRRKGVVLAVAAVVVVLGVLLLADGIARARTEEGIAADLRQQIPGLDPDVTIEGWPFLTQVAGGELAEVHVTAPDVTIQDVPLEDVDVVLRGVSTGTPTTAREARMTGAVPVAALQQLIPFDAELAAEGDVLVGTGNAFGLPLEVVVTPRPSGRAVEGVVESISIGGAVVDVTDIPVIGDQIRGFTVPLEALPEGLAVTSVDVVGDRLELVAEGADVVLDPPPTP